MNGVLKDIKKRNPVFDLAKGLAIFFVVLGHATAPFYWFYTSFHVLFFFIFSGIMYKTDEEYTFNNFKNYIFKIIKRYATPYIFCNLLFLLFYNIFFKYKLITHDTRYAESISYINFSEFAVKAFKHIFLISSSEQLCGATWFLKSLFWGLLSLYILRFLTKRINKFIVYIVVIIFLCIIFHFYSQISIIFYYTRTLALLIIGDILKAFNVNDSCNNKFSYIGIIILPFFIKVTYVFQNELLPIIMTGIFGFYFILYLSIFLFKMGKILSDTFIYLGKHTISILCFHLLGFKIFTYYRIYKNNLNFDDLGYFPILPCNHIYETLLYSFIGVLFAIILNFLYDNLKKLIKNIFTEEFHVKN